LKSGSLKLLEPSGPVQACIELLYIYLFYSIPSYLYSSFCINDIKTLAHSIMLKFNSLFMKNFLELLIIFNIYHSLSSMFIVSKFCHYLYVLPQRTFIKK